MGIVVNQQKNSYHLGGRDNKNDKKLADNYDRNKAKAEGGNLFLSFIYNEPFRDLDTYHLSKN